MSWAKLDDHFPTHPKVLRAGPDAAWLHVCAVCYCAQHLTDGFVPKEAVATLSTLRQPGRSVARLVEVGLWHDRDDQYEIHDYLAYNPSREHVENERRASRERRARDGRTSGGVRANGMNPVPVPEVLTEPLGSPNGSPPKPQKRATQVPTPFEVTDAMSDWAEKSCPHVDWERETPKFIAHHSAKGTTFKDWKQGWRSWMLKAEGWADAGPKR